MPEQPAREQRSVPARLACPAECRAGRSWGAHHDRLLDVETDPDAIVELFETAVTWAELEYPEETTIPPARWVEFAEKHRWRDPERALRIFALAADAALRGTRAAAPVALGRAVGMDTGTTAGPGEGICPTLVPAGPPRHLRVAP
ncbi:hypothetical protein LWC35_20200 [Pseudonocardia kujensis]|uniref:hypothetical protein n=1 Tax=Pseudonocardia kujensis TaxID=1128675 RepID=UPI001E594846|nr:hypothetical protein [Pseudonocardia kujensis]MCE0765204.1 hypothetical protein [Pseudonocardia kujensis]